VSTKLNLFFRLKWPQNLRIRSLNSRALSPTNAEMENDLSKAYLPVADQASTGQYEVNSIGFGKNEFSQCNLKQEKQKRCYNQRLPYRLVAGDGLAAACCAR
jgi:hypothetical protein